MDDEMKIDKGNAKWMNALENCKAVHQQTKQQIQISYHLGNTLFLKPSIFQKAPKTYS